MGWLDFGMVVMRDVLWMEKLAQRAGGMRDCSGKITAINFTMLLDNTS